MLFEPKSADIVFYQKLGDGYVRLDDWNDVDADAMLKSISENTETDNAKRKEVGISALHVVGWVEPPYLDRSTNTVQWAIEVKDDSGDSVLNRVAIVLGRNGYEKIIWIGREGVAGSELLKVARSSFSLPTGGHYEDHQEGDRVAEYGIAGLVATALGAKVAAKIGLIAIIAIFAKAGVLILIAIGVLFGWIRRLFSRRGITPPASPPPLPGSLS